MDIAAITIRKDRRHKHEKAHIAFVVSLFLILLILSRYIVNGEPVDIRSDAEEIQSELALYDGVEICQPLVITEEMNWRQGYYALHFTQCDVNSVGRVIYTVEQGEILQTGTIDLREIESGKWFRLKHVRFGRLECEEAVLRLRTENVAQGELAIAAGSDYYGFGPVYYDGLREEFTLAQAYHYHITGMEYKIRLVCYGIVILCVIALLAVVNSEFVGNRNKCLITFGIMTLMFMAVIYLLDSSIYLEPTYAEAVTNFLHYAREEKLKDNLLISDAGYLPLLQRLITLFFVKVIRIPSAYALYFMQASACLICSMIWSFFVLPPFQRLMKLPGRIIWCVLVVLTCFCEETLFFTNHVYWGIYLLLLMLVADLEQFSGRIYVCLLGFCALICLSKGAYAVMLPFMFLYLIIFYRCMSRREKIYVCVVGMASFLQILYAFSGKGDGGSWITTSSGGQIEYLLRLAGRTFTEFTAYLLLPIGEYIRYLSGVLPVLTLTVFVFLAAGFIKMILLPVIKRKTICRQRKDFYAVVMFQLMAAAFFMMTVKPVPTFWREMGNVTFGQMGCKYEIFSDIGFYMILLTGSALVTQRRGTTGRMGTEIDMGGQIVTEASYRYGILALTGIFCVTNPLMNLTGWKEAEVSDQRVYSGDINTSWWKCKDMLQNSAYFIPVRGGVYGDNWGYSRNATIYQAGTDLYFEETSCVNVKDTVSGYHSSYEIQDTTQAKNLIGIMIRRPERIILTGCKVQLLDADNDVIAESEQTGEDRYQKMLFSFQYPVNDSVRIQFVDENGSQVYYKDYIAWISAW